MPRRPCRLQGRRVAVDGHDADEGQAGDGADDGGDGYGASRHRLLNR
ncbi:MAG: hypothetical protein PVJ86_05395 [Phycisphaerales bacterium]